MKKLKYMVNYLGLMDHYGNRFPPPKYEAWMKENCKGKWSYNSPEREVPHKFFFDMEFYFSRKNDMDSFRKKFG